MVCVYVMYTCLPELIFADSDLKKKIVCLLLFYSVEEKKDKRHRARKKC